MDINWTVKQAFKLKAKIAAVEARYEKRRDKYYAQHKAIVAKVKEACAPWQQKLDTLKQVILDWRDNLPETQEPTLEGVEFRRGKLKFDPDNTRLAVFLAAMEDCRFDNVARYDKLMRCLAWDVKAIQSCIDKMGELHDLPVATIKDRGTIVLKEKKNAEN